MRQNLEYNLRIFANFHLKTQKYMDFAYTFSKNYIFFLEFLSKIILFTLKIYFFTMKDAQSFVKISYLVTCSYLLSVIWQNLEYNLRILANFGVKTQKSTDFTHTFSKNYSFFFLDFLIKIILFTLKIYFFQRKMPKVS